MKWAIVLFALLLAGCQTTADQVAAARADDAQCQSYGIKPNDPGPYYQCRANLENSRVDH